MLVWGLCVRWNWGGLIPRQRVWQRRQQISLCHWKLFIDTGEAEMDPNGSLGLSTSLQVSHTENTPNITKCLHHDERPQQYVAPDKYLHVHGYIMPTLFWCLTWLFTSDNYFLYFKSSPAGFVWGGRPDAAFQSCCLIVFKLSDVWLPNWNWSTL